MLDTLQNPVQLRIPVPKLSMAAVVEVERQILQFFAVRSQEGLSIVRDDPETPSDWFLSTLRRFLLGVVDEELERGADPQDAVSRAVIESCSYAAPAYFVGRALQLAAAGIGDRDDLLRDLEGYLRTHPLQRSRLEEPEHIEAVPEVRADLLDVLQRSAT